LALSFVVPSTLSVGRIFERRHSSKQTRPRLGQLLKS
jgi:hypothetical protein